MAEIEIETFSIVTGDFDIELEDIETGNARPPDFDSRRGRVTLVGDGRLAVRALMGPVELYRNGMKFIETSHLLLKGMSKEAREEFIIDMMEDYPKRWNG